MITKRKENNTCIFPNVVIIGTMLYYNIKNEMLQKKNLFYRKKRKPY